MRPARIRHVRRPRPARTKSCTVSSNTRLTAGLRPGRLLSARQRCPARRAPAGPAPARAAPAGAAPARAGPVGEAPAGSAPAGAIPIREAPAGAAPARAGIVELAGAAGDQPVRLEPLIRRGRRGELGHLQSVDLGARAGAHARVEQRALDLVGRPPRVELEHV